MQQLPPEFGAVLTDTQRIARAAGLDPGDLHPELPVQVVFTGLRQLIVPARSEEAVSRAAPHHRILGPLVEEAEADGFYLFASTSGGARARFFGPGVGAEGAAATGSAGGRLRCLAQRGLA